MTTEIAILNTGAVALAADSAVSSYYDRKIYNSANKLFTLSKYSPVGIMVYNTATFNGVPWETIIKFYRDKKLGKKSFATISDYADDFLNFIKGNQFSDLDKFSALPVVVHSAITHMITIIRERQEREALYEVDVFSECLQESIELIKSNKNTLSIDLDTARKKHKEGIEDEVSKYEKQICDELKITSLDARQKEALFELILQWLCNPIQSDMYSGIVIAGFGDEELFPAIRNELVDGCLDGYIRHWTKSNDKINVGNSALVCPFAQTHIIDNFLCGYDKSVVQRLEQTIFKSLQNNTTALLEAFQQGGDLPEAVLNLLRAQTAQAVESFERESRKIYTDPVMNVVSILPKEELAAMAEALVSLTSLKKRVSSGEDENVGGPVDVAVISKGDGFIWIKRKHYFDPALNNHFMLNYLQRGAYEE
jgi:hypothetical protein